MWRNDSLEREVAGDSKVNLTPVFNFPSARRWENEFLEKFASSMLKSPDVFRQIVEKEDR